MSPQLEVGTQGISEDWTTANGDYDSIDRGTVAPETLTEFFEKVQQLEDPDYEDGDICPPHVMVTGPTGETAFTASEHTLYYQAFDPDGDWIENIEVTPLEATQVATGEEAMKETMAARIAEAAQAKEARQAAAPIRQEPVARTAPPPTGSAFVRFVRWVAGFIIGAIVLVVGFVGGAAMTTRFDTLILQILGFVVILAGVVLGWLVFRVIRGPKQSVSMADSSDVLVDLADTDTGDDGGSGDE